MLTAAFALRTGHHLLSVPRLSRLHLLSSSVSICSAPSRTICSSRLLSAETRLPLALPPNAPTNDFLNSPKSTSASTLRSLIHHYTSPQSYPSAPIWSFSSLEPHSPERQKSLRSILAQHGITDDLQFLRWRNALHPSVPDVGESLACLGYGLGSTPSLFEFDAGRAGRGRGEGWEWEGVARMTPVWVLRDIVSSKLSSVYDIPPLVNLLRSYPLVPAPGAGDQDSDVLRSTLLDLTLFALSRGALPLVPRLVNAVLELHAMGLSPGPSSSSSHHQEEEEQSRPINRLIRALLRAPYIHQLDAALPSDRRSATSSRKPKHSSPTPSPPEADVNDARIGTYSTPSLLTLLLLHLHTHSLTLDPRTRARLLGSRPALPVELIKLMAEIPGSRNEVVQGGGRKMEKAVMRASAWRGDVSGVGRMVDEERKRASSVSGIDELALDEPRLADPVPVSASFDKRASSHPLSISQPDVKPASITAGRQETEKGAITSSNVLLLHAFRADKRSRDDKRTMPHAPIAYFRKLLAVHDATTSSQSSDATELMEKERTLSMLWNTFLTTLASQRGFPADKLLLVLNTALARFPSSTSSSSSPSFPSPGIQIPTLTTCINALVTRGEYDAALAIWRRMLGRMSTEEVGRDWDWIALGAGARALGESGMYAEVWGLFERAAGAGSRSEAPECKVDDADKGTSLVVTPSQSPQGLTTTITSPSGSHYHISHSQRQKIATGKVAFLASFMRTLAHHERPDLVYLLWDAMIDLSSFPPSPHSLANSTLDTGASTVLDDTLPNDYTLNTMLMTASNYSRADRAESLSQQMGFRFHLHSSPSLSSLSRRALSPSEREPRIAQIRSALEGGKDGGKKQGTKKRRDIGFWWHDRPAWQIARQTFRDILLNNWPELRDIEPPVSVREDHWKPLIDLSGALRKKSRSAPPPWDHEEGVGVRTMADMLPPLPPLTPYHTIQPSQRTFDAYIQLLCTHSLEHEIPLAFAWQRALGVLPSRRSVALALAHFGDIGAAAPFDEAVLLEGGGEGSEYSKLKRWLKDWVGKDSMPTETEIARERSVWHSPKNDPVRKGVERHREWMGGARWRRSRKDLRKRWVDGEWRVEAKRALAVGTGKGGEDRDGGKKVTVW